MKLPLARREDDALVLPQVFEPKVGHAGVAGVLPAEDLAVPGHGAAEAEQVVGVLSKLRRGELFFGGLFWS